VKNPNYFKIATERILASQTRVPGRGIYDMDIMVGMLTRLEPFEIVKSLSASYPKAFRRISGYFDRANLLVIREISGFWVFALADPRFDPANCLIASLDDDAVFDRIEATPLGKAVSLPRTVREIKQKLRDMDDDTCRALWAAMAFSESADLSEAQINGCDWWTCEFIDTWQPTAGSR